MAIRERIDYSQLQARADTSIDLLVNSVQVDRENGADVLNKRSLLRALRDVVKVEKASQAGGADLSEAVAIDTFRQITTIAGILDGVAVRQAQQDETSTEQTENDKNAEMLINIASNYITFSIVRTTLSLYEGEEAVFNNAAAELSHAPKKIQKYFKGIYGLNQKLPTIEQVLALNERFKTIVDTAAGTSPTMKQRIKIVRESLQLANTGDMAELNDHFIESMTSTTVWAQDIFTEEEKEDILTKAEAILATLEIARKWRDNPDWYRRGIAFAYLIKEFGTFARKSWLIEEHTSDIQRHRRNAIVDKRRIERLAATVDIPAIVKLEETQVPSADALLQSMPDLTQKQVKELWRETSHVLSVGNEEFAVQPCNQFALKTIQKLLTVLADNPSEEFLLAFNETAAVELTALIRDEQVRAAIDASRWIKENIAQLAHPDVEWKSSEGQRIAQVAISVNRPRPGLAQDS